MSAGDSSTVSHLLASGVFGIPEASPSRDLQPILNWFLKGDHAADLTLAILGTAISQLAAAHAGDGHGVPLTRLLGACSSAARETALGQFITQVQGAEAMMRVRKGPRSGGPVKGAWQQAKSMNAIAVLLGSQVRSGMKEIGEEYVDAKGESKEIKLGGKQVVSIMTQKGDHRMITLRTPEAGDWELLEVARKIKGEADAHRVTWMSFTMMVLCAAQAEAGWFDIAQGAAGLDRKGRKTVGSRARKGAHQLVLSDAAWGNIKKDLDAWMGLGFIYEPMVVEPVQGDYLSVKHREVAGGRGPMGLRTDARHSASWNAAADYLSGTAWTVPEHTLAALRDSRLVQELAGLHGGNAKRQGLILSAYRAVAQETVWLPIYMDFRGRVYPRTTLVTYQGNDLQKSLLVFPNEGRYQEYYGGSSSTIRALAMHMANLYAKDGLDKAPLSERERWLMGYRVQAAAKAVRKGDWGNGELGALLQGAKKPLQLLTALGYLGTSQEDRIACQIDGTCNGLQHLSALFRDETAAPFVNLSTSNVEGSPGDIYGEVGHRVGLVLGALPDEWAARLRSAVRVDRGLCKGPVMVLPYGGTRGTVEDAVLSSILDQAPDRLVWTLGLRSAGGQGGPLDVRWLDWEGGDYAAFKDRELPDHPLLRLDAGRLGGLLWDEIELVIPKAMRAMAVFREIAKRVGSRTLEWDTGFSTLEHDSLWVTQARAVAAKTGMKFKGFQLPGSVRGLAIRSGRDEIDKVAHTSGIVANFIHSLDAAHMARTAEYFGKKQFGANHDCFITRPSLVAKLGKDARRAFRDQYAGDPLSKSVMMFDGKDKSGVAFGSWYALAAHCGVEFPEDGTWTPDEVLQSAWFFS